MAVDAVKRAAEVELAELLRQLREGYAPVNATEERPESRSSEVPLSAA